MRQLVEQVWAVVDALAGGGALLGGPQPANALPLIDLSLPHYHLHHLSHSHQHTFHMSNFVHFNVIVFVNSPRKVQSTMMPES